MALVLVAAVPVFGLHLYDQIRDRDERRASIATEAGRLAVLQAERLNRIVEGARAIALTVAELPSVRSGDGTDCAADVRRIVQRYPQFVGIGVAAPDGRSFCRSTDGPPVFLGDRPYFQEAVREKRFTASGYMVGRAIGRPTMVFAAPGMADDGRVLSVVIVAFALDRLREFLVIGELPEGAAVAIIDRAGVLVARFPEAPDSIGTQVPYAAALPGLAEGAAGAITDSFGGSGRIYGYAPLEHPARFSAVVSLPLAPALASIDSRFIRNLILLTVIFVLAAVVGLIGGARGVRRPLLRLESVARAIASGDLTARARLDRTAVGEIGKLASSFDAMAKAIEERETALAASEVFNRRILSSSRDCIEVVDLEGRLQSINAFGLQLREAGEADLLGRNYADLWDEPVRARFETAIAAARAGEATRVEGRLVTRSGREQWWDAAINPIPDAAGRPERLLVISRDMTAARQAEAQRDLLIAELDHRVNNTFAAIQSMAGQTLTGKEEVVAFTGRVGAMATAHKLLSNSSWEGADLRELLSAALQAHLDRIHLDGPRVELSPRATQTLGLVAHELAINASKYGALSVSSGRVAVSWRLAAGSERLLLLEWTEHDGPVVAAPATRGFGVPFIQRSIEHELDGKAEVSFGPQGVQWVFKLRPSRGASRVAPRLPHSSPAQASSPDILKGKHVLLVEDTLLAAMEIEAILAETGCNVVGPARDIEEAMDLLRKERVDGAVLDIDLDGQPVFPLATVLQQRGIPFFFLTGYSSRAIHPGEFATTTRIEKPIERGLLLATLASTIATASGKVSGG